MRPPPPNVKRVVRAGRREGALGVAVPGPERSGSRAGEVHPKGVRVSREGLVLGAACLALCAAVLGFAGRHLETPGLYYDEVIQATPASEFLREGGRPLQIPGAINTRLFGGWFPVWTQAYMSGLKSQLLIPSFALFGADRVTLRLTTLVWGCAGLVFCVLWIHAVWGLAAALLAGALLACDPSFLFVTRHDWGSVSLALVCRGAGLWLLVGGFRGCAPRAFFGGLLLGLGVTNKIDAAPFLLGAALALAVSAPGWLLRATRERPRRLLLAGGGVLLGALPMLATLPRVWGATRGMLRSSALRGGDLAEKLATWHDFLDGSHFHRLMLAGGRFEELGAVSDAASGPFLWIVAASALVLVLGLTRDALRGATDRREGFALAATLLTGLLLLATPRAARIHHVMNVLPLPQLLVALAVLRLWRGGKAAQAAAALGLGAALAGHLWVDARTFQTLVETGGRGRWSDALERFAAALPADATVVSLDWGFHAPLVLLRPELALEEPIWRLSAAGPPGSGATLRGSPRHVYLVQEPGYQVFEIGNALLAAAARLPGGIADMQTVRDREGAPVFRALRFTRPHELVYRGEFEVRLR